MKTYSIENSERTVLRPNSEFERRIIFQYYLDNDIKINSKEKEILLKTDVSEHESIGIIGCLLNDSTHLNTLRLAIGSKNLSNKKLSNLASSLFNAKELEKADTVYFVEKNVDDLSRIENIITSEYLAAFYSFNR
ncbi:hypothetical protein [Polaribacter sp. AHE13PA]|uniref:hypothetical protein n=1 Tax=Polaribacter sp. AHE13PA TaxID=2745562 RepID=UPI001C4FD0B9|nr:hypothetical protein [Polaribacter sp. AHE13PA]QXP68164.1 hypothetical protein H0I28_06580 [Polaribacter sp. AHE13PA]